MEVQSPAANAVAKVVTDISVENGMLQATNIETQYRLARAFLAGGLVPKAFDSPEKIMAGMQFASELGIPGLSGLRQIAVIHGTPSIFGDLPLALCYKAGLVQSMNAYLFDEKYKPMRIENENLGAAVYGAYCQMTRKDGPSHEATFTVDDAKKAGLWGKSGPWSQYPKRMLELRVRSHVIKNLFPDALMGAAIAEYDFNVAPSMNEAKGVSDVSLKSAQDLALATLQLESQGDE